MERPAQSDHPIHELLVRRWSPRHFDANRRVSDEQLMSLLEAARWAPSSFNEQPWRYLVFDQSDPAALRMAQDCLTEGNAWAKQAPVLLLTVAKMVFTRNGKPNRHHAHDAGAASISLALQATALGLAAHQMAGFNTTKAMATFGIPEGYEPVTMIAIGYPVNEGILSEEQREKLSHPRKRRHVSQIASRSRWDGTLM